MFSFGQTENCFVFLVLFYSWFQHADYRNHLFGSFR